MVDLKTQYENIRSEIDNAIFSVINSTAFIKGPEVKLFEEELQAYLGVKHVISCANGTDALQIAMMSLGLKPGDEVITTNFTFIATVETVALLGLKPVIVDPEPGNFNISVKEIKKAITLKTKAIVPVHLFGQCADMEGIMKLAKENNLLVIEDAAQATGTDYILPGGEIRKAGTIGNAGTTSFFPSKNLSCFGDGGAIYTNDDDLAKKLRSIANHGMKIRYHYDDIGVNSRLDTLQAAILRVKLKHLDRFNNARKAAADYYDKTLAGCNEIAVPEREKYSSHIFHQYTIRVKNGRLTGTSIVMPGPRLDGASLFDLMDNEGVTGSLGVPTVWRGLINEIEKRGRKPKALSLAIIGGSACPRSMIEELERAGVEVNHA